MGKEIRFSVNGWVKVKLNDVGREVHVKYWESFPNVPFRPPKEDEDGYSKWQLWGLMQVFGSQFHVGCKEPFDLNIIFITDDD